ncbi:MAG: ATP-dependent RecD-like DNA helicase [Clostridia bacterium]|nr:ATP-dependent RecD-like DNA helicase [Clostridia bacterium]
MNGNELPEAGEQIRGVIEEVIYHNENNGYTVLSVAPENGGEPVTAVGELPFAAEGETIVVSGRWELHQTYGRQLHFDSYEKQLPVGAEGMLRYLSSGAVKGVGPMTAKKIVETFGDETFEVMEKNPEFLARINGISPKKAAEIGRNFASQFGMRKALMFLAEYFGSTLAARIYKKWGAASEEIIRRNPYVLCDEIEGIGFERADRVAEDLGVETNDPHRIDAGIEYTLNYHAINSGHCFLPEDKLSETVTAMLGISEKETADSILRLQSAGRLRRAESGGKAYIYLARYYDAERYVAEKLILLHDNASQIPASMISGEIALIERESGLRYAAMQKRAITAALTNGVMILTGGPGTGKTTVIKALIRIFTQTGYRIALAAPTGRAAKRMSEATGEEAKTLHRLLEAEFGGKESRFNRCESQPLDEDVFIIDEMSMVDILLMDAFLHAVKRGARLVLIGDADQLPSVGAGNVLYDLIASETLTTVCLKEIFRQAKESRIVTNAHAINAGEYPVLNDRDNDFFFVRRDADEEIADTVKTLWTTRLPRTYGKEIVSQIQVITPSRKGCAGTEALNVMLQEALNPPSKDKVQMKDRGRIFRTGDKIMQIKNDYEIPWKKGRHESQGVFNGDVGTIARISYGEQKIEVDYEGRIATYDFAQVEELDHAYAITVHKSQGSEYPVVILPLYTYAPPLLTRELLYTAVTRARKMVIIVGSEIAVKRMVDQSRRPKRFTGLRAFLRLASENA